MVVSLSLAREVSFTALVRVFWTDDFTPSTSPGEGENPDPNSSTIGPFRRN